MRRRSDPIHSPGQRRSSNNSGNRPCRPDPDDLASGREALPVFVVAFPLYMFRLWQ